MPAARRTEAATIMLTINADDFGRSRQETDAVLACYKAGRVTSTSAMVFMEDSERAAGLVRQCGLEVGLHLNFSQEFTYNPRVIPRFAKAHRSIVRFLCSSKYALLFYHPLLRRQFRDAFDGQLKEFVRLYGKQPSHFDGHRHMHLCTNMLLDRILPEGQKVRGSFSFSRGEKSALNRAYRHWVNRRLAARHRLTDYFFALSQNLQSDRFDRLLQLAATADVEIMTHPTSEAEAALLMSDNYTRAIQSLRVGYATVL